MALFRRRHEDRHQAFEQIAATLGWSYERDGGKDIDALDYYLLPGGRPARASEVMHVAWPRQIELRVFSWEAHGASELNHLGTSTQTISKLTCALACLPAAVHTTILVPVSSRRNDWGLPAQPTGTELDRAFTCYSRRPEAVTALARQPGLVDLLLDAPNGTAVELTGTSALLAGPRLAPDSVADLAQFAGDVAELLPPGSFRSEDPAADSSV
jgi:hypothetical protein